VDDTLVYISAVMVALLGVSRLTLAGRARAVPAMRHGTNFTLAQAAAMLAAAPETVLRIDRLSPLPNTSLLLSDLLRMTAAGSLLLLSNTLPAVEWPPGGWADRIAARARRPTGRAPVAVAVLLFLCAHASERQGAEIVTSAYGRLLLAGYDLLILGYTCVCLSVFAAALTLCTRELDSGLLRQGLLTLRASTWIGALWALWGIDDVVDVLRGGIQYGGEDLLSGVLGMACVGAAVIGATISIWNPVVRAAGQWLRDYRRYRALGPQWRSLHGELPQIALRAPSPWRSWVPPRDAHFALYRRTIEIHDARLALRSAATDVAASNGARSALAGSPPGATSLQAEADDLLRAAADALPPPTPYRSKTPRRR